MAGGSAWGSAAIANSRHDIRNGNLFLAGRASGRRPLSMVSVGYAEAVSFILAGSTSTLSQIPTFPGLLLFRLSFAPVLAELQ